MTPQTPTGKRMWEKANENHPGAIYLAGLGREDILAIEREAAQQERERLRAALPSFSTSRIGTGEYMPLRFVYDLLADPEAEPSSKPRRLDR